MLVETAHFLLLVLVAVFFPGFSHHPLCSSSFWANRAAAWLVAHDGLNPLGQGLHILLNKENTSVFTSFHSVPTNWETVDELYLMKEVLINHVFNSPDFLLVRC